MAPTETILVITGASGLVGSAVVIRALRDGYNTLLTVRNESQIPHLQEVFGHKDHVRFVVVPDLAKDGAFDGVVKDVDYVIHTASPLFKEDVASEWRKNYIDPAVNFTLNILNSTLKQPRIKKVVITSSIISFVPLDRSELGDSQALGNPKIDKEEFYNQPFQSPIVAYHASKIASDIETWDFQKRNNPHFNIVSIHPDFVYGGLPLVKSREDFETNETTAAILWREYTGVNGVIRFQAKDHSVHVDDVAEAHVKVVHSKYKDERYIVSAGEFEWDALLEHAQTKYPGMGFKLSKIPDWKKELSALYFTPDASKASRELGIKWKDIYQQFDSLVESMKSLGAKGK
ncbi:hypothetical protein H072_10275 [Dactylellina haptotyla CBS 200.50]|uniref:NAD-dependent epimerase/dehydratase domain-containing protein n=1 Tax=Dactylellina haptotyla (strain CBS 200.50) TaxID=1284197 RepID=S7ZZF3_DACHA|nr:hypothetical protein H072_10275 [Dactylellina haptotyla CBS 200.50]